MRNIFTLLLAAALLFAFAGCVKQPDALKPAETPVPDSTSDQGQDDMPIETENPALKIMLNIWEQFQGNKEDFVGGCNTEYQMATPWQVPLSDTDFLQGALFLSDGQCQKVTGAASLMHGLNTNNLTVGTIALEAGTDYKAFAKEVKERILQNQWVCGRPGGLRIVKVENCLLILYGTGTYSGSFVDALNTAYPDAEILCQETI